MKMIQNKHKKLNEDLQNQQLKYYLELLKAIEIKGDIISQTTTINAKLEKEIT